MKNLVLILVFIVSVIFTDLYAQKTYSIEDGLSASKSNSRIGVLAIISQSDNWSKKMESVFSEASNKSSLDNNFNFMKLDVEEKSMRTYNGKSYTPADLAKLLGGTGYPTLVFFGPDGKVIHFKYNNEDVGFFAGYIEAGEFAKLLNYFSSGQYKNTDLSKVF